jgi:hypothetical protein
MYKLTIEFKTIKELAEFVKTNDCTGASLDNEHTEVKEAKTSKPAPARAKKSEPVEEAVAMPPVIETPVVKAPAKQAAPSIGKPALIAQAQELIGKLKASGIAETQIMPTIKLAYSTAGIPVGQKIGELDEVSLVKFMPIFESAVNSIISGTAHSFI